MIALLLDIAPSGPCGCATTTALVGGATLALAILATLGRSRHSG